MRQPNRRKKKSDDFQKDLDRIEREIEFLRDNFRPSPEVNRLMRSLQGERSYIKRQIEQLTADKDEHEAERAERYARAQHNRSEKNRRNWRYAKAISVNYDIPIYKVRHEIKRRKKGLDSDIQDVIWRNPSP